MDMVFWFVFHFFFLSFLNLLLKWIGSCCDNNGSHFRRLLINIMDDFPFNCSLSVSFSFKLHSFRYCIIILVLFILNLNVGTFVVVWCCIRIACRFDRLHMISHAVYLLWMLSRVRTSRHITAVVMQAFVSVIRISVNWQYPRWAQKIYEPNWKGMLSACWI